MKSPIIHTLVGITVGVIVSAVATTYAWTGPTLSAPNGNVPSPINTGTTDQVKNAGLGVNSFAVFGNGLILGGSLNIGTSNRATGAALDVVGDIRSTTGRGNSESGAYMRWHGSGFAEFGGYNWATKTYTNVVIIGGNLGIGSQTPAAKLDVLGSIKVGNGNEACGASTEGVIHYNLSAHGMEYCNGTSWMAM